MSRLSVNDRKQSYLARGKREDDKTGYLRKSPTVAWSWSFRLIQVELWWRSLKKLGGAAD